MKKVAMFLVACMVILAMGSGTTLAAGAKTIKYGGVYPLSGPAAPWGIASKRALEMAAEEIGEFTVAGKAYKWQVVSYDHKYNPADAVSAMNKVIYSDNITMGTLLGSGTHPPNLPIIRENKWLNMGMMAGGDNITNPDNPTIFRVMASSDQLIIAYFEPFYEKFNVKKMAIIAPNDEMGKADVKVFKRLHKERKVDTEIVAIEYYERGITDFYPALKRMLAKNPDTICSDASPTGTVALIAKQARELGFKGPIYNPTGVLEAKSLWETAGKGSDNIVVPRIWAKPPNEKYVEVKRKYEEKYKEDMLALVPEMYPLLFWLVEAMQKANSVDAWEVTQALRVSTFEGHPFGPASWGGEKTYGIASQIEYPIPLSILKDGKWEEVMVLKGEFP